MLREEIPVNEAPPRQLLTTSTIHYRAKITKRPISHLRYDFRRRGQTPRSKALLRNA